MSVVHTSGHTILRPFSTISKASRINHQSTNQAHMRTNQAHMERDDPAAGLFPERWPKKTSLASLLPSQRVVEGRQATAQFGAPPYVA